jgi:ABC-type transporter Mla subunit MlaD
MPKTLGQLQKENDELFAKINQQLDDIANVINQQANIIEGILKELEATVEQTHQFVSGQQPDEDELSVRDFQECDFC